MAEVLSTQSPDSSGRSSRVSGVFGMLIDKFNAGQTPKDPLRHFGYTDTEGNEWILGNRLKVTDKGIDEAHLYLGRNVLVAEQDDFRWQSRLQIITIVRNQEPRCVVEVGAVKRNVFVPKLIERGNVKPTTTEPRPIEITIDGIMLPIPANGLFMTEHTNPDVVASWTTNLARIARFAVPLALRSPDEQAI